MRSPIPPPHRPTAATTSSRQTAPGWWGPSIPAHASSPSRAARSALVDAGDYEALSKYRWCAKHKPTTCYAVAQHKGKEISMHRLIMDAPTGLCVDHIDHNGLNNTRKNLRLCTAEQNYYNRRPRKGCRSKYKGVSWIAAVGKFRVRIAHEGKQHSLGYFTDKKEAARAYDKKANEFFGEFAYLNFPSQPASVIPGFNGPGPIICGHLLSVRRKSQEMEFL